MANAKKCDRCGAYYEKNESMKVSHNGVKTVIDSVCTYTKTGYIYKDYDLCDNCVNDFINFICGAALASEEE